MEQKKQQSNLKSLPPNNWKKSPPQIFFPPNNFQKTNPKQLPKKTKHLHLNLFCFFRGSLHIRPCYYMAFWVWTSDSSNLGKVETWREPPSPTNGAFVNRKDKHLLQMNPFEVRWSVRCGEWELGKGDKGWLVLVGFVVYLGGLKYFFGNFHPYLGKVSNLTNIFQMGWNHQPVVYWFEMLDILVLRQRRSWRLMVCSISKR